MFSQRRPPFWGASLLDQSLLQRQVLLWRKCFVTELASAQWSWKAGFAVLKVPVSLPSSERLPQGDVKDARQRQFSTTANTEKREEKNLNSPRDEQRKWAQQVKCKSLEWWSIAQENWIQPTPRHRFPPSEEDRFSPQRCKAVQTEGSLATSPSLVPPNTFGQINAYQEILSTNILAGLKFPKMYLNPVSKD